MFDLQRRAPITVERRPRNPQCHRHCLVPASLPDGAGIPAFHTNHSEKDH